MRGPARLFSLLVMLAFLLYVVHTNARWASWATVPMIAFFLTAATITLLNLAAGVWWRSYDQLPLPEGRVLGIVPVYEEESETVHRVVWAMLNQTRPPDQIVVMDDGSEEPLVPFEHPKVIWMRQVNQGKRHAQVNMLKLFAPGQFDFIFTVDSDSVADPDALEHLLRAFSNEKIQAATGMFFTRNRTTNWMTKMTDINIISSCLQQRMMRSWFGIVTPTSGALALYRSWVLYENIDDYLTSGAIGDDRRLSFYALMRGEVVGVSEAICETNLPDTWRGAFKQRTRWSKSAWLGLGFVITNLSWPIILLYSVPLLFSAIWPFSFVLLTILYFTTGDTVVFTGIGFWWIVSMTTSAVSLAWRPGLSLRQRITTWLLALSYPIWGLVVLRIANYKAILTLHDQGWGTRGPAGAGVADLSVIHPAPLIVAGGNRIVALPLTRERDTA